MKMIVKIIGLVVLIIIMGITVLSLLNLTNRHYHRLVGHHLSLESSGQAQTITHDDLSHLPNLIQNYLNHVGVVGTEHVSNFQILFDGTMKMDRNSDFSPFTAKQTSFVDQGVRLFYMDMHMNGLKVSGLHHFDDEDARMKIKLLDVFPVVNEHGKTMQQAETVTFFNDMVLFAPQTLIDAPVEWEKTGEYQMKASFTHEGITVEATLVFGKDGRLINFISGDRAALEADGLSSSVPWSTPITEYEEINGLNLPKTGHATWHYDDGEFTYITLNVLDVTFNVDQE